jgi:hypothetical protein
MCPSTLTGTPVVPAGMSACAKKGAACALSSCYPCYCGGLAAVEAQYAGDGEWLDSAKHQCDVYVDSFDWRSLSIRCACSSQAGLSSAFRSLME